MKEIKQLKKEIIHQMLNDIRYGLVPEEGPPLKLRFMEPCLIFYEGNYRVVVPCFTYTEGEEFSDSIPVPEKAGYANTSGEFWPRNIRTRIIADELLTNARLSRKEVDDIPRWAGNENEREEAYRLFDYVLAKINIEGKYDKKAHKRYIEKITQGQSPTIKRLYENLNTLTCADEDRKLKKCLDYVPDDICEAAKELFDKGLVRSKTAEWDGKRSRLFGIGNFKHLEGIRVKEDIVRLCGAGGAPEELTLGDVYPTEEDITKRSWAIATVHVAACFDFCKNIGINVDKVYNERMTGVAENGTPEAPVNVKTEDLAWQRTLAHAKNPRADSLFVILQGEPGPNTSEKLIMLSSTLYQSGKKSSEGTNNYSFEALAARLQKPQTNGEWQRYTYDPLGCGKLYVISDFSEFYTEFNIATGDKKAAFQHVIKTLGTLAKNTYVVLILKNEDEKKQFYSLNPRFEFLYEEHRIVLPEISLDETFRIFTAELSPEVLKQVKDKNVLFEKFKEYIAFNKGHLPFTNSELAKYMANYCNIESRPVFPPSSYSAEKATDALEQIVGMEPVKEQLRDFEKFITFQKIAEAEGMKLDAPNFHMLLLGNAGTGKTSIARIVAALLYDIGILKENKLKEVEKKDLVAGYVGQTAIKTAEIIKDALGGVLFIDEAYSLTEGNDSFGKEALATLIKAMEDHKNELVVMFAGYEKEMTDFVNANPGIKSRIGYTFKFEDYSPDELVEMFKRNMVRQGFKLGDGVLEKVKEVCTQACQIQNFGNGRFVKKLERDAVIKHAKNYGGTKNIRLIVPEEIPDIETFNLK